MVPVLKMSTGARFQAILKLKCLVRNWIFSMNDDTIYTGIDALDATDSSLSKTYTQVASCAFGNSKVERRRQSLRARLERERYERQQKLDQSFISTFRNFISSVKH
jgi:hypothetical protein